MTIIELKDCNIINMYNSYTDEYYDDDYYGCPTCGGASIPDTFILEIVTNKFENETIEFYKEYKRCEEQIKNDYYNLRLSIEQIKNKPKYKLPGTS